MKCSFSADPRIIRFICGERRSGKLVAKLSGHGGTVNSISCSPQNEDLFATGSDDKTVIVRGAHMYIVLALCSSLLLF